MTILLKVDVYSHNFSVTEISPSIKYTVENYARKFIQYGLIKEAGRWIRQQIKIFVTGTKDRSKIRFHINQYAGFIEHMEKNGVDKTMMDITIHPIYNASDVNIPMFEKWKPREDQIPYIDYIVENNKNPSKFIGAQTGFGKTKVAFFGATKLHKRIMIIVRPMYMDKWHADVTENLDIDFNDTVVVKGSTSLISLIEQGVNKEIPYKVIIISNKTLQPYLKLYEQFQDSIKDLGYGCLPQDLCETLDVGVVIMDEIHQDFHLNYKIQTYMNVPKSISLSATLVNDDEFLESMYKMVYPPDTRHTVGEYVKFINSTAILYKTKNPFKLKYKQYGSNAYSHNVFEQCIKRYVPLDKNYIEMIIKAINHYYIKNYHAGDRCLIYCASVDYSTHLVSNLKRYFKGKDVRRYVEEDPYENIMKADICVSTLLSAGTGLDIAGLTTVILTTNVLSSQSNIQGFGRLRNLKGKKLNFVYFVCEDLDKHLDYHYKKQDLLKTRALVNRVEFYRDKLL